MEHVTISEFLHLTRLTDKDLLVMLENGDLSVSIGQRGNVLIDISMVTPELLAARSTAPQGVVDPSNLALIQEQVASEVVRHLDGIIGEAAQLAEKWCNQIASAKSSVD